MTDPIVVTVCLALLIAWVIDEHLARRSVETRIAEDTCEEHAVFCCPWCLGAKDDDAPGRDTCRAMPDDTQAAPTLHAEGTRPSVRA